MRGCGTAVMARRGSYLRNGAYVCKPNRAFKRPDLTHLAFYADTAVQPEVPEHAISPEYSPK